MTRVARLGHVAEITLRDATSQRMDAPRHRDVQIESSCIVRRLRYGSAQWPTREQEIKFQCVDRIPS